MTEILREVSDFVDAEPQCEQLELIESEELLFPKLDGILLPVVIENAEVIAPCRWMGGVEVSLTIALNNYYQLMTEENADDVIADVYEFLAYKPETAEEIIQEIDLPILIIEHDEIPRDGIGEVGEVAVDIPPTHIDTEIEIAAVAAASISRTQTPKKLPAAIKTVPTTRQEKVEIETKPDTVIPAPRATVDKEELGKGEDITVLPIPIQDVLLPAIEHPPRPPLVLEIKQEHVVERAPNIPLIADHQEMPDEHTGVNDNNNALALVSEETGSVQTEPHIEVQETGITLAVESIPEPVDYESEYLEASNEDAVDEYDSMDDHAETPGIEDETTSAAPLETDVPVLPQAEIDNAINKIDALLASLNQPAKEEGLNEADEREILRELVEVIAEISKSFKPDRDGAEIIDSKDFFEEQLLELYIVLLEDVPSAHKAELASLLVALTLDLETSREEDQVLARNIIHKRIKGLTVIVKKIKKTWNHVVAIGRLALRSHAASFAKIGKCNILLNDALPPIISQCVPSGVR